ncbi:MAG: SRPBCC family protein [Elusimicrobia bacterium]|nr:SRPBCC family protein [Elusimicrobiota bacterium]
MVDPDFHWPPGFAPNEARLYVRNTRRMAVPVENVWAWLVAAPRWPEWYPNARNVELEDHEVTLTAGTRFRWSQTGVRLSSEVREFVPGRRIAWFARSRLIQAYHAWDLQPDAGLGTLVVTDETQRGLMPLLAAAILRPRMLAIHELWLERLDMQAKTGVM